MTTDTRDDCRRAFEDDRAAYHRDWSDNSMPITTEEDAAYKAGWDDCYARYRPSAAGEVVDKVMDGLNQLDAALERIACLGNGRAWGNSEGNCIAQGALIRLDGLKKWLKQTALPAAPLNVEELVRGIEGELYEASGNQHYERFNDGLNFAIALIRKWAEGGK